MNTSEAAPEWEVVADAQKQKDILTREVIALPIEKFRQIPYQPPPFPSDAAIEGQDIDITEERLTVRDGTNISLRVYKPIVKPKRSMLIFNAHGGGIVDNRRDL